MLVASAALGLVLGPACRSIRPTRAFTPDMALLDFINRPGELFKSSVTIDSRAFGGAPETLAGKQTSASFDPAFKFDRRNIKTAPKKTIKNTFPAALMPGAKKGLKDYCQ